jgi:hypothetical protein
MKTQRILAMVFLLLAASATFSQTSRATNADAARSWTSFWRQFTAAVNKKDRVALKKMMADDFYEVGGGMTASDWLKDINWREHQKSAAAGTKPYKLHKGLPARITKDNYLIFEFKNERWWWWGISIA